MTVQLTAGWLSRGARALRPLRPAVLARRGGLEYDRIMFFSDAVFAIAITLLVVDLPVQLERVNAAGHHVALHSGAELRNDVPGIVGFGVGFAVIGLYWAGHHAVFRYVTAFDKPLMMLNLLVIGLIAFLPYPTELLSSVSASQTPAVMFYSVCAGGAGLVETIAWVYARHAPAGLVADIGPQTSRLILLRTARIPVVFGLSIPVALFHPKAAAYCWLGIMVTGIAINRAYGHHEPDDRPTQAGPGGAPG